MTAAHYTHSTLRERIAEHVFVGDALRTLWRLGTHDVEVLRSEFDAHGYDLVMARGPVVRHIQFKTGTAQRPPKVSLARVLAEKPSGCAIWIRLDQDLNMGPYFWFGGAPGQPLPAIDGYPNALRPTRNKEGIRPVRANHHEVPGSVFKQRDGLMDVLENLLGLFENEGAGVPS
uniref:PD(D/E)XK endonuclease domain-containing protein n=1 Tax=Paracoccus marcusii TaxID=59779 RepID=J7K0F1_9RHOB|nr:hypothetical protein [Paracoccus marcusii]AFQ90350.1 hypothetical protein [Paracoccus marcusii]